MNFNFDRLQQLAENLTEAIAQLPTEEKIELSDTLYSATDLNLDDLQALSSTLSETLKSDTK